MWNVHTDTMIDYLNVCNMAVSDEKIFAKFRRMHAYMKILEHVSYQHALEYIDQMTQSVGRGRMQADLFKWKKNDLIGGAVLTDFDGLGSISTSTLRYVKIAYTLESLFKDIESKNICEIGCGYGGQIRLLNALFGCHQFTVVDQEPALLLAQKWLQYYGLFPAHYNSDQIKEINLTPDIVISNYAFSELSEDEQMVYYNNILRHAKAGYMIYNVTPGAMEIKAMQMLLKNSIIIPEGLSGSRSNILIWGNDYGPRYACES
jgi:putative sugar O-methyltransferase